MRTTWKPLSNETKLTFLLIVILSFTCLTSNSFGFSESDVQKLLSKKKCIGCDLSRAFLVDKDLSEADLTGANLSKARLQGANLTGASLTGANLSLTNLTGADLSNADLTGANLKNTFLGGANLDGTIGLGKALAEQQKLLAEKQKLLEEKNQQRQKEFLNIISSHAEKYKNAKNEIKKSLYRKKRIKAFKSFFASNLDFQNWVGKVISMNTDKDGDATIQINVGGVKLNNYTRKIKLSDNLFDTIAEMEIGDKVVLSGTFNKHPEALTTGWYLHTANKTEKGAMTSPNFMVGYSDIKKAE